MRVPGVLLLLFAVSASAFSVSPIPSQLPVVKVAQRQALHRWTPSPRRSARDTVRTSMALEAVESSSMVLALNPADVATGFINGGGLLAIPIVGALGVAVGIGAFLWASAQPEEFDEDE